jgi:hypothetical protein
VVEILSGTNFTSSSAIKTLHASALGFLGFLSALSTLPYLGWCAGFAGFFGFFWFIGLAFIIEIMARRRATQAHGQIDLLDRLLAEMMTGQKSAPPRGGARPPASGLPAELRRIRRAVKRRADGLVGTGVLSCLAIPLTFLATLTLFHRSPNRSIYLLLIPLAVLLLSGMIIIAGLKMKRLEAYALAIAGSVLAVVVTLANASACGALIAIAGSNLAVFVMPGTLVGLPLGIWALAVLSRREVREAFAQKEVLARPQTGHFRSELVVVVLFAVVVSVMTITAGLSEPFLIPILVLCLLGITVASVKTVARANEPSPGGKTTADAWIVVVAALLIAGGLLIAGLFQKARSERSLSFDPASEATSNDPDDLRGGEALGLDNGRSVDLPKEIKGRPQNEQMQWLAIPGTDMLMDNSPVNGWYRPGVAIMYREQCNTS